MVNIVTLGDGRRFMVDVGFGVGGPVVPMELVDGGRVVSDAGGVGVEMRLGRGEVNGGWAKRGEGQMLWVLQGREGGKGGEWRTRYCFTELEFLPQDFEIMSFWTSQARVCFFTHKVVCVRFLMDEGGEVVGTVSLFERVVKKKVRGREEVVMECKTEGERLEVLETRFGIILAEEEKAGIRGLVTELKGS